MQRRKKKIPSSSDVKKTRLKLHKARQDLQIAGQRVAELEALGIDHAIKTKDWSRIKFVVTQDTPNKSPTKRKGAKSKLKSAQSFLRDYRSLKRTLKLEYERSRFKLTTLELERRFPKNRGGVKAMVKWIEGREHGTLFSEFAKILPLDQAKKTDASSWDDGFRVGQTVGILKKNYSTPENTIGPQDPIYLYYATQKSYQTLMADPKNKGRAKIELIASELMSHGVRYEEGHLYWTDEKGNKGQMPIGTFRNRMTKWKKMSIFHRRRNVN